MTSEEIRIELYRRKKTASMSIIARSIGVSRQAVYHCIDRRHKSARIAQAVADAIERPLEEVFPELAECANRRSAACN
jgi:predicted DNA-binding protein YlxM (UPF0122 family)